MIMTEILIALIGGNFHVGQLQNIQYPYKIFRGTLIETFINIQ